MLTALIAALALQTVSAPQAEPTLFDAAFCSGMAETVRPDFEEEDQAANVVLLDLLLAKTSSWLDEWLPAHPVTDADRADLDARTVQRAGELDARGDDALYDELDRCAGLFLPQ